MKTSLKNNQLPFLSMLPFCLMAVSAVCFPLTGEAAEVELGSTDTNNSRTSLNSEGGVSREAESNFNSDTGVITGSVDGPWAIWGGYSEETVEGKKITCNWKDGISEARIKPEIFGGYVSVSIDKNKADAVHNSVNLEKGNLSSVIVSSYIKGGYVYGAGEHDAQDNTVELKDITAESNVYGTHVWLGKGTAESNSVSLIGSSVSGFVVGALQEEGQGNEVRNSVEAENTKVARYIYGGYIYKSTGSGNILNNQVTLSETTVSGEGVVGGYHTGTGDVTGNRVTLKNGSEVKGFVIGGHTTGLGSADDNHVTVTDTNVGDYVYGGYVNSFSAAGTASSNTVTVTNSVIKGSGTAGGHYIGIGSAGNPPQEDKFSNGSNFNLIQVITENNKKSEINTYVIGGNVGDVGTDAQKRLYWDANKNRVELTNTGGELTVNGYVAGGFNQSAGCANSSLNEIFVTASPLESTISAKIDVSDYVVGGYIWGSGDGSTNSNTVNIKITNNSSLSVGSYIGGGFSQASGKTGSSNNKVSIDSENNPIEISSWVFGGLLGAKLDSHGNVLSSGVGSTNDNEVTINNANVKTYIVGGYNQGYGRVESDGTILKTDASHNKVTLSRVTLKDPIVGSDGFNVVGHFVVGGLIDKGGIGNAETNVVTLSSSSIIAEYVAGGVHLGKGLVQNNQVNLTNTKVVGFVAGGLDWYGEEVSLLSNNHVVINGGEITGRVVGARSMSSMFSSSGERPGANDNSVTISDAKIKKDDSKSYKGHVLGAANQGGGDALGNKVLVKTSEVDGYVGGGYIEGGTGGFTDGNNVTVENSTVGSNIAGGYNQAGGSVESNNNHVTIQIDTSTEGKTYTLGGFVSGGIIGKEKLINENDYWGSGSVDSNTVTIDNLSVKNTLSIAGYVAGGYFDGAGEGSASHNKVYIGQTSPSTAQIHIGSFVLGGFVGTNKKNYDHTAEIQTTGETSHNQVLVNNALVKQYVVGGYNSSSQGDANENFINLDNVSLLDDSGEINEHFVAGGLIEQAGNGNAYKNTVQLTNSNIRVKYVAGGVSQGNGQVNENTVVLVDTAVQGLVVGGLDWGDKNVSLTGNKVSITGGSVREVLQEDPNPANRLTGRVVGARSIGSGNVFSNSVQLQDVEVEGAVRGGVSAGGGSALDNQVVIQQSRIKQSVAGGYIEAHLPGERGNALNNSVVIRNSSVEDNVEGGFNQVLGKGDASQNKIQIEGTGSFVSRIAGFVAGGVIGEQSEGNTDANQVTILARENASIVIAGYVAGGFNDGTGHGGADGNTVWLETALTNTSKLTVDNFIVGGYLRSGEGSTNGNTVVIKNVVVSGPYIAAGLNEGLGRAQNNSVILENADVTGGVTGGRVTANTPTSSGRSLNVANSNIGESGDNYSALVQNNTVTISGKTSVVGWVVGGESLAGNTVKEKPAYIQNNTVVIEDGYVEGRISGGAAVAGNVIGNKIFLNGGTIKGLVYGGTSTGEVKNNIVYLDGRKGIDVTGAWIYGRGRASTGTNGNTLNITNFKGAMQNIGNFDRIDLDLAGLMVREKEPIILLTENQSTNLDNSTIHIHSSRKAIAVTDDSSLADRYEVIKNQSGSLTAFNVIYEKDKLVVVHERGTMEGLYRVEWDGYPDQIGDSIDLVLERVEERPESGTYISNSLAWSRMHMRLHDRFGQAYYIDPFSGEERAAAGWVRQVGSHSHFRAGSDIKTHSRTAVTQIGADLVRNEFNQDVKSVWGVFAGGLYNRSSSKTYSSAQSRSDGYALGVYGTLYTGNSPDDGFYVDSWLLFGHYNNKLWSDDLANFRYKSNGWVWSVESGYTIPLSQSGSKDFNKLIWTFQPEIQLVWDGVKADTTVDKDTETRFKQLGTNNVSLRVGARLHANHMNKGLGFIEGNWIHNTKRAGVQMGTGCKYIKGGRNLAEFRAGLEGHVTKNLLGWATVGVQAGQYGYHNETAQIGLKYMF